MIRFGRRWSRPQRLVMRRGRPPLGQSLLVTHPRGEAADVRGRCKVLEGEMQGLRDQLAKEARLRQEEEEGVKAREAAVEVREAKLRKRRDRLRVLEKELEATKVELDGKARFLPRT